MDGLKAPHAHGDRMGLAPYLTQHGCDLSATPSLSQVNFGGPRAGNLARMAGTDCPR